MPTLDKVSLDITVVLGNTAMPIHQVLRLGRGAIIELDASENDEVQILANNLPVAKGAVVVQGNRIAVEVRMHQNHMLVEARWYDAARTGEPLSVGLGSWLALARGQLHTGAYSSAWLERFPDKEEVDGSSPSRPT